MISALAQDKLGGNIARNENESGLGSRMIQSRSVPRRFTNQLDTQTKFNKDGTSLTRKTKELREIKLL